MTEKIFVTGAPGNVGSPLVKKLIELGADFRIGAYDVDAARKQFGDAVEIVKFDFLDPATFAFDGCKRLFLVRPPALADVKNDIAPALEAAKQAGVAHIIFLSIQGVENNRVVPHYKIEQYILGMGLQYTFLRASFFMQNLSTTHRSEIRDEHQIVVPVGKARTSFIDARDIAAVAVETLTTDQHRNEALTLTGGEALNYYDVARIMSRVLPQDVSYANPSMLRFLWRQLSSGKNLGYALVVTALYTITRFGNAKQVTDDVRQVLGREPIKFEQFVRDYHDCWLSI